MQTKHSIPAIAEPDNQVDRAALTLIKAIASHEYKWTGNDSNPQAKMASETYIGYLRDRLCQVAVREQQQAAD